MRRLEVGADGFTLPAVKAQTATLVVYGGKGMGKTNCARVLVEELAAASLRFAVLDPVGVWWGLRYATDGKRPGVECLLLGGPRGDLPIEPLGGAVVADLVVDEDVNVVVDLARHATGRMWTHGEQTRFVGDYATRLYERQGERRRPLLQVIDEAGRLVPEMVAYRGDKADRILECRSAIERLVELGRNVGVGVLLITQRSARMAKSVSELADAMVAFRTVGPRSVSAILDWFGEHVEKSHHARLLDELRKLPVGTALVVSPGWLEYEGSVAFREARTYDSSATPEAGRTSAARGPGAAPVDLERYRSRIAEAIERAEAANPTALQRKVAELERRLAERPVPPVEVRTPAVPVPVVLKEDLRVLEQAAGRITHAAEKLADVRAYLEGGAADALKAAASLAGALDAAVAINAARTPARIGPLDPSSPGRRPASYGSPSSPPAARNGAGGSGVPELGPRRLLGVLKAFHPAGLSVRRAAVLTGYRDRTVRDYASSLATAGYLARSRGALTLTPAGLKAAPADARRLSGREVLDLWLASLPAGPRAVLELVYDAGDGGLELDAVARLTGYSDRTVRDYRSTLSTCGLIVTKAGRVILHEDVA